MKRKLARQCATAHDKNTEKIDKGCKHAHIDSEQNTSTANKTKQGLNEEHPPKSERHERERALTEQTEQNNEQNIISLSINQTLAKTTNKTNGNHTAAGNPRNTLFCEQRFQGPNPNTFEEFVRGPKHLYLKSSIEHRTTLRNRPNTVHGQPAPNYRLQSLIATS